MPKRQRKAYDSNFKLEVVSYAEQHCNTAAEREYEVNEKLVRDWRKKKMKLISLDCLLKKMRRNPSPLESLEKHLFNWVTELHQQGYIVTRTWCHQNTSPTESERRQDHRIQGLQGIGWMVYRLYESTWPCHSSEDPHCPKASNRCREEGREFPSLCIETSQTPQLPPCSHRRHQFHLTYHQTAQFILKVKRQCP